MFKVPKGLFPDLRAPPLEMKPLLQLACSLLCTCLSWGKAKEKGQGGGKEEGSRRGEKGAGAEGELQGSRGYTFSHAENTQHV